MSLGVMEGGRREGGRGEVPEGTTGQQGEEKFEQSSP